MATRLCVVLYSMVTLAMFLRVSREFYSMWSRIDVTLLVLWNLPVVYLAAPR
jgi:nicotinamide riboside transporter PnuC